MEAPSEFHQFSQLPPELRTQIWRNALPVAAGKIGQTLHFWKRGGWSLRPAIRSDLLSHVPDDDDTVAEDDMDPGVDNDMVTELDQSVFEPVAYTTALAHVNFETRELVKEWAREQGLAMRPCPDGTASGSGFVFVQAFVPIWDVIYLTAHQLDDMEFAFEYRNLEQRIINARANSITRVPAIQHVAVPDSIVTHGEPDFDWLHGILEQYLNLRSLYIIVDAPADLAPVENEQHFQKRWEIKYPASSGEFVWDDWTGSLEYRGNNTFFGGHREQLYMAIVKSICNILRNRYPGLEAPFRIAPVYAVRR